MAKSENKEIHKRVVKAVSKQGRVKNAALPVTSGNHLVYVDSTLVAYSRTAALGEVFIDAARVTSEERQLLTPEIYVS